MEVCCLIRSFSRRLREEEHDVEKALLHMASTVAQAINRERP